MQFKLKKVSCNTHVRNIQGVLCITGYGRISIGDGTRMNSGPRRNPIGGDTRLVLACRGGEIEIGENCGLSNCAIVSDTRVTLEANVLVGGGAKIYDTDFHNTHPEARLAEKSGEKHGNSKPVLIKKNAFIGAHSIILKGVTIGENSIIGAGSVVTHNIPANEIWAGNPATCISRTN
jgi:acetyltransferase-like isoleucine patch superfamily enzyme